MSKDYSVYWLPTSGGDAKDEKGESVVAPLTDWLRQTGPHSTASLLLVIWPIRNQHGGD